MSLSLSYVKNLGSKCRRKAAAALKRISNSFLRGVNCLSPCTSLQCEVITSEQRQIYSFTACGYISCGLHPSDRSIEGWIGESAKVMQLCTIELNPLCRVSFVKIILSEPSPSPTSAQRQLPTNPCVHVSNDNPSHPTGSPERRKKGSEDERATNFLLQFIIHVHYHTGIKAHSLI